MNGAPNMKRLAFASMAGTALEYYDFAVYNTLAALVFNKLFFPAVDPLTGTLLAFATYWVGYLSRPFGGLLFGNLGDRRGRRFVLMMTLLIMGACTTLIGLLRAVGMTRHQVSSAVRWEAGLVATLGSLLGIGLGVFFGWAISVTLRDGGLGDFALPVGALVVVTAIGVVGGVLAAVRPAWRAAHLDVLRAIASH